ncbi:MAG: DoxX family protein [Weeksellaceae bacterium]|nr:DoxX family protein [Weeksellaceae bacterium]
MRIVVQIVQWLVGLLFIFSGLVKTIDPIGFAYKLEDYFAPEVLDLPFLIPFSLPMSIFFVIFEVLLGVLLILGIWKRWTFIMLLALIIFFTFLTFYSAYYDKVTDCGCFGDAIKLEPWQSFYKDVILLVALIFLWVNKKYIYPLLNRPYAELALLLSFLGSAYIAYHGLQHLPLIDFRAYKVGDNIVHNMKSADELGKEPTRTQTMYHLRNTVNNSKIRVSSDEFVANDNYWKSGTVWEVEKTDTRVVSKGYEPPIRDFSIDCDGEDQLHEYMTMPRLVMIITYKPEKVSTAAQQRVETLIEDLQAQNIPVISLVSNPYEIGGLQPCFADDKALKTVIRSNPGIVAVSGGTVVAKYHHNDTPDAASLIAKFP